MSQTKLGVLLGSVMLFAAVTATASEWRLGESPSTTEPVYDFNEFSVEPEAYGLVDNSILALSGWAFKPYSADTTPSDSFRAAVGYIYCIQDCVLEAQVNLPSGALITGIEVDLYDNDAAGQVTAAVYACAVGPGACPAVTNFIDSGTAAVPGSTQLAAMANHTVLNGTNVYIAQLALNGGTANTRFQGYRIFYKRQISPAPGVATFQDVPTNHSFFVNVEALAASGITGGCGGANYCPNAFVTRGQMAAFLSRALGLHWDGY